MGKHDREALAKKIEEGKAQERKARRAERKAQRKKEKESFWTDFKKFITRGNVLDMAVAVVMANAFNAIVNGLVKQIITPCVTYFTSGVSINEWEHVLRPELLDEAGTVIQTKISIQYGLWIQSIVDFIIIAFSVFVFVRIVNRMRKKMNYREEIKAAAEAKKKAEEKAAADKVAAEAAAEAAAKAAAAAAEKAAIEAEFYANVKEQAALLRDIKDILKNK